MTRGLEFGTAYVCSAHRLRVQPGTGDAPLEHEGGNAGRPCSSQLFTRTERVKVGRDEVVAALAGEAGDDT